MLPIATYLASPAVQIHSEDFFGLMAGDIKKFAKDIVTHGSFLKFSFHEMFSSQYILLAESGKYFFKGAAR